MRYCLLLLLCLLLLSMFPMHSRSVQEQHSRPPQQVGVAGLHNVFHVMNGFYSGSSPDDDQAFQSLRKLGVRTIISVDGARPPVELARKYGIRYVHLPIGYDGVPREQALRIAKAVQELPGPVYLHCHHGKHRGPAAAAVARLWLDERCTIEAALELMQKAGTDPHYIGLFASPKVLRRPTAKELADLPAVFPEVARVAAMAQLMVEIDRRYDFLKESQAAGWKVPPAHPDIDPPHEARLLAEQYREATRLPNAGSRPHEFGRLLAVAEAHAKKLEDVLQGGKHKAVDAATADETFRKLGRSCMECHAKYRDVPQR